MKILLCIIAFAITAQLAAAQPKAQDFESFFDQTIEYIISGKVYNSCQELKISCQEQIEVLVDAIIFIHDEELLSRQQLIEYLYSYADLDFLSIGDQIKIFDVLFSLDADAGGVLASRLNSNIMRAIEMEELTARDEAIVCYYFQDKGYCNNKAVGASRTEFNFPSQEAVRELLLSKKSLSRFRDGKYIGAPQLFMFCRKDRRYHCLMVMKDKNEKLRLNKSGDLWSLPVLGFSKKKRPYYKSDGDTPAGVLTIDGVMPEANKRFAFGDYRRLILNFISKGKNESETKKLIPFSSQKENWWKEAAVSRDVGRNYLRIHGVGWKNFNSNSLWYPFVPTRGCVTTREGVYEGVKYRDQRLLLDEMMQAQGLTVKYSRERRLRGLLYVVNLNDAQKNVSLSDVKKFIK